MATALPLLPNIERLSPRVIRVLGGNPGKFTLQGTNTYIVGSSSPRLLIDTGEGEATWLESISKVLQDERATISKAVLTHWHPDHVGGVSQLQKLSSSIEVYENDPPDASIHDIADGQTFSVPGATLRAFHCPGHTANHMAFILAEEDAMFTGDNVLGHGTAVFEDLAAYMQSLYKMEHQFNHRAYPGHGALIEDGPAEIREYIEHRKERKHQVMRVLKEVFPEALTPMEIVKVIYKDYNPELYEPASRGVMHILQKLESQGKVAGVENDRWVVIQHEKM